jgi:hemolysin activation/secretion protein
MRPVVCCLVAVFAFPAFGQTLPAPGDLDLLRNRQLDILQEQQKRLEELRQLPGAPEDAASQAAGKDMPCFEMQAIEIQGSALLPEAQKQEIVKPFLNRCLKAGEIDDLLEKLSFWFFQNGYVTTRAYLPEQDLHSGVLRIQVIEGKLEELNGAGLFSQRELAMFFPGKVGEVLNLRELEQLAEQAGRLPSRPIQMALLPGSGAGKSKVELGGEKQKPWRVSLARYNEGQRATGIQQGSVGLDWDSPLGQGGQLRLYSAGDIAGSHWRHSESHGGSYSIPYGWWTFSYAYSGSGYRSLAYGNGFSFRLHGQSRQHQLRVERTVHRDDKSKTAVNAGFLHLRTQNYLEDVRLNNASHRVSEFQLGLNHGRRIGNAFLNADFSWQRGTGALDAEGVRQSGHGAPSARYNKYTLAASYLHPFLLKNEHFSLESLLFAQKSNDVLPSPQRVAIGGIGSVRAFREQSLAGDTGGYWRNQLRWTKPVGSPWLREWGAMLAWDAGAIKHSRHSGNQHGRMGSKAVEWFARSKYAQASLAWARSLDRPNAIEKPEQTVYFRLAWQL